MPETSIRTASIDDVRSLYNLLKPLLVFDDFSSELLIEKLFANPLPEQYTFETLIAERDGELAGMMQYILRPSVNRGWIGMFGVATAHQKHGVATELINTCFERFRAANCLELDVLALPGNYFMPGLDPRYTAALTFLERNGFERGRDCVNMVADLSSPLDTTTEVAALEEQGISVRRVSQEDGALLDAFFAKDFGEPWRLESELALRNDPPAIHLALKDGEIIAFSAHSTQNREWGFFGPMGTTPAARGTGLGRVLLLRCLEDMRDAGHKTSIIPWVGPIGFYARNVRCQVDRVFWRYLRKLEA